MDDMERYGDYNEIDEPPRGRSTVGTVLKVAIAALCLLVVGLMAFRIVLFNYYPTEMKNLYFNDTLTDYYNLTEGNIGAKTQEIRFPYDHADRGRFFSDHLIVIDEIGQLQITLRYNKSLITDLENEYGVDLDENGEIFTFVLARDPRENPSEDELEKDEVQNVIAETVGTLTVNKTASFALYNYHKLVFDGIDFGSESEPAVEWLRVEVYVNGIELDEPIMLLVYENNSAFSEFIDYTPSKKETP